jgi:hypothetical protein
VSNCEEDCKRLACPAAPGRPQGRASILAAMNQAVTRLYVQDDTEDGQGSQAA